MFESLEAHIRKLHDLFWSPSDPEGQTFVALADTYRQAGDLDQALELLNEGLGRIPDHASGWVVMGWVRHAMEDGEAARRAFERVLELDAENIEGLRGLGTLSHEEGNEARALAYFQTALELNPSDTQLRDLVASLVREDGDLEPMSVDADEILEESAGVDVFGDEALSGWREEGPVPEQEVVAWEEIHGDAEGLDPLEGEASWVEVEAEDLGGPGEAEGPEEDFDETVAEAAEGTFEETRQETAHEAPEAASTAVHEEWVEDTPDEDDSDDEMYTRSMGELYAAQGHYGRAIEIFERLHREDPGNPEIEARLRTLREEAGLMPARSDGLVSEEEEVPPPPDSAAPGPRMEWPAPETTGDERADDDYGLESMGADQSPVFHGDDAESPFSWAEGGEAPGSEPAEQAGPTIGDYFQGMLAWEAPDSWTTSSGGVEAESVGAGEDLPVISIAELAPDPLVRSPEAQELPTVSVGDLAPEPHPEPLPPDPELRQEGDSDGGDTPDSDDDFDSWLKGLSS